MQQLITTLTDLGGLKYIVTEDQSAWHNAHGDGYDDVPVDNHKTEFGGSIISYLGSYSWLIIKNQTPHLSTKKRGNSICNKAKQQKRPYCSVCVLHLTASGLGSEVAGFQASNVATPQLLKSFPVSAPNRSLLVVELTTNMWGSPKAIKLGVGHLVLLERFYATGILIIKV